MSFQVVAINHTLNFSIISEYTT